MKELATPKRASNRLAALDQIDRIKPDPGSRWRRLLLALDKPGGAVERDSGERTMGVEMPAPANVGRGEKLSLQDLYAPGRDGSFHLREDDGGSMVMITMTGRLDDVGQLTHPHQEKFSLKDLYPPRRGNGTPA
jgi:hypothetical protein